MSRNTKIVATLGPACSAPDVMSRMLAAGVDVVRLNFSHGAPPTMSSARALVRECAQKLGREVGDHGRPAGSRRSASANSPAARSSSRPGRTFILDAECELGDDRRVGLDYKELPRDVGPGAVLLLNDGLIRLQVESVDGPRIHHQGGAWAACCRTTRASTAWAAGSPRRR